jgi:hypothetical protein
MFPGGSAGARSYFRRRFGVPVQGLTPMSRDPLRRMNAPCPQSRYKPVFRSFEQSAHWHRSRVSTISAYMADLDDQIAVTRQAYVVAA